MLTLSHSGDDLAKSLGVLTISRTPKEHFSDKVSNSVNISFLFLLFFVLLLLQSSRGGAVISEHQ